MESALKYRIASPGWACTQPNPFTGDGPNGSGWSAFCLEDRDDDQFYTGRQGGGPFSARFGKRVRGLECRLTDFLCYENAYGRTVILSVPPGMDADDLFARALSGAPEPVAVRHEDPAVIVHATTRAAWESIRADGEPKAASQLVEKRQRAGDDDRTNPIEDYLKTSRRSTKTTSCLAKWIPACQRWSSLHTRPAGL